MISQEMAYDFDVIRIVGSELLGSYEPSDAMRRDGWVGGQWVKYQTVTSRTEGNSIIWTRIVEPAGPDDPMLFVLRGSYEGTDQLTGRYPQRAPTGVTCCVYGQYLFKHFEVNNKAERDTPGAGAALTYSLNTNLYVSDRGLLTSEAETGATARAVGLCCALPADNNNYLGCEVLLGPW